VFRVEDGLALGMKQLIPRGVRNTLRRAPRYARRASSYVLPEYIIIGGQKCGTTSLDLNLWKHPSVHPALMQEVHFFDYNYHRGQGWYRRHFHTKAAARRHESSHGEPLKTGESSPYYIFHPLAPARVAEMCPGVKLIALLRNPVDRAYSHYHHERRHGGDDRPMDDAFDWQRERAMLDREVPRIMSDPEYFSWAHRHESYLSRGLYAEQLERWLAHFSRDRLLVLQSEAFYADMVGAMRRVFAFIGVSDRDVVQASAYNKNTYRKIEPWVREELSAFYAEPNERLYDLIGERFDW